MLQHRLWPHRCSVYTNHPTTKTPKNSAVVDFPPISSSNRTAPVVHQPQLLSTLNEVQRKSLLRRFGLSLLKSSSFCKQARFSKVFSLDFLGNQTGFVVALLFSGGTPSINLVCYVSFCTLVMECTPSSAVKQPQCLHSLLVFPQTFINLSVTPSKHFFHLLDHHN